MNVKAVSLQNQSLLFFFNFSGDYYNVTGTRLVLLTTTLTISKFIDYYIGDYYSSNCFRTSETCVHITEAKRVLMYKLIHKRKYVFLFNFEIWENEGCPPRDRLVFTAIIFVCLKMVITFISLFKFIGLFSKKEIWEVFGLICLLRGVGPRNANSSMRRQCQLNCTEFFFF